MTSHARPQPHKNNRRAGTGAVVVSIAAALVAGLLMLAQGTPSDAQTLAPRDDRGLTSAETPQPPAALDAGVNWSRVERAPDPIGAPTAAYER